MPGLNQPIDAAPPSPVTDPTAAKEAGQAGPSAQAIGGLAPPMQAPAAGPDLSGILTLGEKLEQGILTLAQAVPLIAGDCDQMKSILINALGRFASSVGQGSGTSPKDPMAPQPAQPTGTVVSQAGPQFPGAMSGGKPF